MARKILDTPLYCKECGVEFTIDEFGGDPFTSPFEDIIDYGSLIGLKKELQLLYKVKQMYEVYPESKEKMTEIFYHNENIIPNKEEIELWTNGDKEMQKRNNLIQRR